MAGMAELLEPPDWWAEAACAGLGPGPFYAADTSTARGICRTCPVQEPCATHAAAAGEEGVWGGTEFKAKPVGLAAEPEAGVVAAYLDATADAEAARRAMRAAGERRREAVAELRTRGWTVAKVATSLGLSPARVRQILEVRRAG